LAGVVCAGSVCVAADFERGGELASGALAGMVGAGVVVDFALLLLLVLGDVAGFGLFVGSDGRRLAMGAPPWCWCDFQKR
jgi:hypothetical protein